MQPKRPLSVGKTIIFSTLIVAVILSGTELALRVWANYFRLPYLTYNAEYGRPALVPNAKIMTALEHVEVNSRGFVGPEFEKRKASNVRRIISLGDSCTFAGGWYPRTYPGKLGELIKNKYPGQTVEVINAGISGYNSEFALARLQTELLDYDPDLVIIYIGWNDLMKVNPANPAATGQHSGLANILNQSYLVKAYSKFIFFYLRPLITKPTLTSDPQEAAAFDNFVPQSYRANLEAMMETLKARNVKAMLFTLPTVVSPNMSYDDLERDHVIFPYYGGSYSLEKFLSLLRAYNRVVKEVGAKYGVEVVDLYSIINRYPKDDLFEDTMHPNAKANAIIAEAALNVLEPWIMAGAPNTRALAGGRDEMSASRL